MRPLPALHDRAMPAFWCASAVLLFVAGCGAGSPGGQTSGPTGSTQATLLITSTNNAQIPFFDFNLESLTLTASDGTAVPVLTTPQTVELASINGVARPLTTATIAQGTYTSVKLIYNSSTFAVVDHSAGDGTVDIGTYNYGPATTQLGTVTLQLSTPLQVTGTAMGVLLDMNIPQSITYSPYFAGSSTMAPGAGQTAFNPVFSLSAVTLAAQPSTLQDGKIEDLHGQVTTDSGGTLALTTDNGTAFNFTTSSATLFTGASGAAPPPAGSFVDMNAALQADGSMLATLVQTEATTQQYNLVGPIIEYTQQSYLLNMGREQQGPDLPNGTGFFGNNVQLSASPQFQISWPAGTAPAGLAFTPALSAASIVPGQNVDTPINTPQYISNNGTIPAAAIVTLEPQTIDATVVSVSTANGQTTYQVNLFSNDLVAIFGPVPSVTVYATTATHMLTASSVVSGSVARFRGLLFNDGGTLRMVATEIEDGVPGS